LERERSKEREMEREMEIIGWFGSLDTMYEHLQVLPRLREKFGLNLIIPESSLWHTSGFKPSLHVEAINPLRDWIRQPGLLEHRRRHHLPEEAFPVLPGILSGADDEKLWALLKACKGYGIAVWGHFGVWSYGGELFPSYALRDAHGHLPRKEYGRWGFGFCPSNQELLNWLEACLEDALKRYEIDGLFLDHARYPPPASFDSLFGCADAQCLRLAEEEGVRLNHIITAEEVEEALKSYSPTKVVEFLESSPDFISFLSCLTSNASVSDWFDARCRILARQMERLRSIASRSKGSSFPFGSDVFPPSIAYIAGHDVGRLSRALNYSTGGFGPVVGWETAALFAASSWAREICSCVKGLEESKVLESIYRWLRLEGLGLRLPRTCNSIDEGIGIPTSDLLALEFRRVAEDWGKRLRFYAPLSLRQGLEDLSRLFVILKEEGFKGVIFSGIDPEDPRQHEELRQVLGMKEL
jgi:hypothetical protein